MGCAKDPPELETRRDDGREDRSDGDCGLAAEIKQSGQNTSSCSRRSTRTSLLTMSRVRRIVSR
jgi:hypothetical protein